MRHLVNMQRLAVDDPTEVEYLEEKIDWKAIAARSPQSI